MIKSGELVDGICLGFVICNFLAFFGLLLMMFLLLLTDVVMLCIYI